MASSDLVIAESFWLGSLGFGFIYHFRNILTNSYYVHFSFDLILISIPDLDAPGVEHSGRKPDDPFSAWETPKIRIFLFFREPFLVSESRVRSVISH